MKEKMKKMVRFLVGRVMANSCYFLGIPYGFCLVKNNCVNIFTFIGFILMLSPTWVYLGVFGSRLQELFVDRFDLYYPEKDVSDKADFLLEKLHIRK